MMAALACTGVAIPIISFADTDLPSTPTTAQIENTAVVADSNKPNPDQTDINALVAALNQSSFSDKGAAAEALAAVNHPRVIPILQALLKSKLYVRSADNVIVIATQVDNDYKISDAISAQDYGVVSGESISKIKTNNQLRGKVRGLVAELSLNNPSRNVRLNAVREMIGDLDDESASIFKSALNKERDPEVANALRTGIAIIELGNDDKETKRRSIAVLGESLLPAAHNRLRSFLEKDAEGKYVETDKELTSSAETALGRIQAKLDSYKFAETVYFGVSSGAVLLLAAIGLAITFGVMRVINMAHGELIMVGAYTAYGTQQLMPNSVGWSLILAIPAAFLLAGAVGILIERGVIRHLYGRPLDTLLATFGISLILQQMARTFISPKNVAVESPSWMQGSYEVNPALGLTYNYIYIILFSLIVFAALLLILKKTSLGLQVRAVSQNRAMARAMGVRSNWVDSLTFGLGSGIAGVAGVALSQTTNVGPNLGQQYIIDSFMVVVFGGVGNLWGTLVGAMSLGVANKFIETRVGSVTADILVLVFIILFIQKRPRGLFPQKGRAAEA